VKNPYPNGNCDNTRVYIADTYEFVLLSYNMRTGKSWRIDNKLFFPNPNRGTFYIAGENFELMYGVTGLALTPQFCYNSERYDRALGPGEYAFVRNKEPNFTIRPNDRYLYFHSMSASSENIVPLKLLENSTYWDENPGGAPGYFRKIGSRGEQRYIFNA
jgi:hypothetical protein